MVKKIFYLDLRALAMMRVGVGILILVDIARRLPNAAVHYSDGGVFPRAMLAESGLVRFPWPLLSIHLWGGSTAFALALFALQAVAAICVIIGYRTRIATIFSWYLWTSLQTRAPFLSFGGDRLLHAILFWAMFLPWGSRWSQDGRRSEEDAVCSLATVGLITQLMCLYLQAGWQKAWSSDAVCYVLSQDQMGLARAHWLVTGGACRALTVLSLWAERLAPALFLIPGPPRLFAVGGFVLFHLGHWFSLSLGLFPWVAIAGLAGLVAPMRPKKYLRETPLVTSQAIAVIALIVTLAGTFAPIPFTEQIASALWLDQHWSFFSPEPKKSGGWFAMQTERDERFTDPTRDGDAVVATPVTVEPPPRDFRWAVYLRYLRAHPQPRLLERLGDYFCREAKARRLVYVEREILPDFSHSAPRAELLWEGPCT